MFLDSYIEYTVRVLMVDSRNIGLAEIQNYQINIERIRMF